MACFAFEALAENENAIDLMERWIDHWKNVPHIWSQLCFNKNSIELLIKYPDYINWFSLVFRVFFVLGLAQGF